MEKQHLNTELDTNRRFRDVVAVGFRHRRLAAISFLVTFAVISAVLLLQPESYKSEMKILVKRGRLEPVVATSAAVPRPAAVTESDLRSEMELLRSRDLLEQAVAACRLDIPRPGPFYFVSIPLRLNASAAGEKPEPRASEEAVQRLAQELQIVPLRGSNLISASYASEDPQQAACVLNALAQRYVDKHLSVHRIPGAFEFFKSEADRYREELESVEAELLKLGPGMGMLPPDVERDIAVRTLGTFSMSLDEKRAAIAEAEARIRDLERQMTNAQDRHTTEIRVRPNPRLTELESTLMSLQMRRTEMLDRYAPTYRSVQEIDRQIAQVEEAIAIAQQNPLTEEATGRDPEHDFLRLELTKARADLAALKGSLPAAESTAQTYRARAAEFERQDMTRTGLLRMARVAEENYLLYLRKREEARISDQLDAQRILNVALAEEATVPLVPTSSGIPVRFAFAAVLAGLLSMGVAFGKEYSRRTFHTSRDIRTLLGIPAVAAFPAVREGKNTSQQGVNRS